jgi:hypothetical protein
MEQVRPQGDRAPKALCCYGLLRTDGGDVLLRFVEGRPVSHVTTAFLAWLCQRLAAEGKKVWVLMWDNASWPISREVRGWVRAHHQRPSSTGAFGSCSAACPSRAPG